MVDVVSSANNSDNVFKSEVDSQIVKPPPDQYGEFVGAGLSLPFATPWGSEGKWEILRTFEPSAPSVRQLVQMRRTDGQARALYRLITLPIRSALKNATFIPAENGDDEAAFIEQMFTLPPNAGGMTITFQKLMAQILLSVFDGFAPFELIYWSPTSGPLKGKITLQKAAYRPSESITFLIDQAGDFRGFRQRTMYLGHMIDVEIPGEAAWFVSCQDEENPFYGVSLFQSAFRHYDSKCRLYFISQLAAQRQATGTRVGEFPLGASKPDKEKFHKGLNDLGVAQSMSYPAGYKVNLLTEQGSFDFLSYINHHNSQMSKSVLAAFFDKDQGGDPSLVDFGTQSDAMFILMLQTLMDEIASSINHYVIPRFIDWNFGSGKYPEFRWSSFTDEQKASIRSLFEKIVTAGQSLNSTPEFLFELEKEVSTDLGLEIDYDEIQKRQEDAEAAQGLPPEQQYQDPNAVPGTGSLDASQSLDTGPPGTNPSPLPGTAATGLSGGSLPLLPTDPGYAAAQRALKAQGVALSAPDGGYSIDHQLMHLAHKLLMDASDIASDIADVEIDA